MRCLMINVLALNGWVFAKFSFSTVYVSFSICIYIDSARIDLQNQQSKPLFVFISVLDSLVYIDLTIFPVDRLGLSDYTTLLVFV